MNRAHRRRLASSRRRDDLHLVGPASAPRPVVGGHGLEPIERASDADRVYFAAHPWATSYLREHVPGEFGEPSRAVLLGEAAGLDGTLMVEVEQVRPGVRIRRPAFVALEGAGGD